MPVALNGGMTAASPWMSAIGVGAVAPWPSNSARLSRIEGRSGDKIPTARLTVPVTLQAVVRVRAVRAFRHESMSSLQLDLRASRMLLADWFARLAGEKSDFNSINTASVAVKRLRLGRQPD